MSGITVGTDGDVLVGDDTGDDAAVYRLSADTALIFTVDFIPIEAIHFRNMLDGWVGEWEDSLRKVLAMNWDRMIPGHPYAGGRLGTKGDVQNLLQYMGDLSAAVKVALASSSGRSRNW